MPSKRKELKLEKERGYRRIKKLYSSRSKKRKIIKLNKKYA